MLSVRPAAVNDVSVLATLIRETGRVRSKLHLVVMKEQDLVRDGFAQNQKFRALVAEWNSRHAGYAVFFGFYSTWKGRSGLFLEDLYVRPEFPSRGIGKAFLGYVTRTARQESCYGVRWEVLDSNQPAIKFYQSLGAIFLDERRSLLICEDALDRLAEKAP
jgi:GNAT superfamily N-acetyltransferase